MEGAGAQEARFLILANSGSLTGYSWGDGRAGDETWPGVAPGATFPGNRHGPGAGGGGGVIFTSSAPGSWNAFGGIPGTSTLANDAYGATTGQPGETVAGLSI